MRQIFEDEIVDTILACPYCGTSLAEIWSLCCGEAGHAAIFYVDKAGEMIEASEVAVVPRLPIGSQNNLWRANEHED